jgi:hypothetical protein
MLNFVLGDRCTPLVELPVWMFDGNLVRNGHRVMWRGLGTAL